MQASGTWYTIQQFDTDDSTCFTYNIEPKSNSTYRITKRREFKIFKEIANIDNKNTYGGTIKVQDEKDMTMNIDWDISKFFFVFLFMFFFIFYFFLLFPCNIYDNE